MTQASKNLFIGGVAGLLATFPMTIAMKAVHRRLPLRDKHALPPRKITSVLLRKVRLNRRVDAGQKDLLTSVAHLGYGAAAGSVYGGVVRPAGPKSRQIRAGARFGLAVWVGSYLGWLPFLRILPPATRENWRRNALMLAAHLVWGSCTAALFDTGRRAAVPLSPGAET